MEPPKLMSTTACPSQGEFSQAVEALTKWQEQHGVKKALPAKLRRHEKVFQAAFRHGSEDIFIRLMEQSLDTQSRLPATKYSEAREGMKLIASFPRFMPGPEKSERVRECLMPLFVDLFHLAFMLAEDGDDPESDSLFAVGLTSST
jgi:hypothetical protein